jgi:cysteate synthase
MEDQRIAGYKRMNRKYRVRCVEGGEAVKDPFSLHCTSGHDSLLRTEYARKRLPLQPYPGMFRYLAWLPVEQPLLPSGGPVTFRSGGLGRELGLKNLFISFSGYFPERNTFLTSGSFKELEALPTLQRIKESGGRIPVIASAGNTGRAFAEISAKTGLPVVIVVPERALPRLWTTAPAREIFLITLSGDYTDAIEFSNRVAAMPGCMPEGGARNVARRDGMGTVMLDAAVTTGRMPDHYFQAIGSGTGAIAAWEAAMRLVRDGRFGTRLPRLHLVQNEPFTPMVSAWRAGRSQIIPDIDMPNASAAVAQVMSDVLTNRNPPYGIRGGVYDAMTDAGGTMYGVANREGHAAALLIREAEGIDVDPAAAVATGALVQSVSAGGVAPDDHILLNLTGGGYERIREDLTLFSLDPSVRITPGEDPGRAISLLNAWMTGTSRRGIRS